MLQSYPELDVLLIDLLPASSAITASLDACHLRLLVMQDEPASIADAYGLIKLESRKDRLKDPYLVPNRVSSPQAGKSLFDKMNVVCMKFLEEPVNYLYCVLQDELLAKVTRQRETLIEHHPGSAAAQNFNQLADQLINLIANQKQPAERWSKLRVAIIDAYEEQNDHSGINIGEHYALVERIAYHLRTRLPASIATDDLIQAGMEGLIHAQRAFEPSFEASNSKCLPKPDSGRHAGRGTPYFTYTICITIKREQDQAISAFSREHGRAPKSAEVADYLGKDIATYEKERLIAEGVDVVSSDAMPTNLEESSELELGPDQNLKREQTIEQLADAIEQLLERARMVLALYYQEEMNLKKLALSWTLASSGLVKLFPKPPVSFGS